jgi:hypothetical protein
MVDFGVSAQTKDAELWENLYLEKQLSHNYNIHFNHEGRMTNNISKFNYAYGDFGFTGKLIKNLKYSVDYVLVFKQTQKRASTRHQWYVDLSYKIKMKPLELNLRSMFQQQVQDIRSSDDGSIPEDYFRNKATLKYQFGVYPWYKFEPYMACEVYDFLDSNTKYQPGVNRIRYFMGVFYNVNKKNAIELYYLIENNFNINNPPINYVIGLGYAKEI